MKKEKLIKILFINFAPLDISSGHTFRLSYELGNLAKFANISILCVRNGGESKSYIKRNERIRFYTFELEFEGWNIRNLKEFEKYLYILDKTENFNLIIINSE